MSVFQGIYPILYAFFDEGGRLDREAMRRQTEACVRHGAHGLAALGLATEVSKLERDERHLVMEWLLADVAGRVPVAITVFGDTAAEQIDFVKAAADLGAAWVILQPPPRRPLPEEELRHFFGEVADASPIPVAIQNAPQYLGVGLGNENLLRLRRHHPNFVLLKGEASALEIKETIDGLGGEVTVFNGRGGLELPDILAAGCAGMIPAPECFDVQIRIYEALGRGDRNEALALYRQILPLVVFVMQSVPQFLCYGKRVTARRLGLGEVFDREPCQKPTALGLEIMERYARELPAFDV
ncbi:dihydrodipicolinate synthase family protein [Geminicoccaceae bacterium 1502E]|nr:dihydrodipicolinate synthase family protein [Geminicoccaceae bacterium 1502E]